MADPITFDLSRIQEWTRLRQDGTPAGPYMATYEKEGRRLQYIAADHEKKDIDNPTLPLINAALNTNPKAVIIETTPPYQVQPGDILGNDEAKYTAALAGIKNIPWIAGEASNEEVFSYLEKQGYFTQDAAHFYMLRAMVDENKNNPGQDEHSLFQTKSQQLPPEQRPSEVDFNRWFAERNNSGKSILQMTNEDTAPTLSGGANYFNIISHHVSMAREKHLDRLIEQALNEYGDVVVVYGKGHHLKSQQVYEVALGKPEMTTAIASSVDRNAHEQDTASNIRVRQTAHHER